VDEREKIKRAGRHVGRREGGKRGGGKMGRVGRWRKVGRMGRLVEHTVRTPLLVVHLQVRPA
jgi:hypothetical protein